MTDATKIAKLQAKALSTTYPRAGRAPENLGEGVGDGALADAVAVHQLAGLALEHCGLFSRQHRNPGLSGPPNAAR
jgi:hypothetical protein